MNIALLSDIHGNREALHTVLSDLDDIGAFVLLGDIIDYGVHSNEVIDLLRDLPAPVICNIRGNHEQAVITQDYSRFSSVRGQICAQYTRNHLSESSWQYITQEMLDCGMVPFALGDKRCLAVHGSMEDIYWKSISPQSNVTAYHCYDYVFSGHSHLPHFFEAFYEAQDPVHRNKKKTVFINPGSVGQPRNLNPMAQFAILNTESGEVTFKKVPYNITMEQSAYTGLVDDFYRERLTWGV